MFYRGNIAKQTLLNRFFGDLIFTTATRKKTLRQCPQSNLFHLIPHTPILQRILLFLPIKRFQMDTIPPRTEDLSGNANHTDADLALLSREELIEEIAKLRAGIREHRDSSGNDLCWHHPKLWNLLPEKIAPQVSVPEWPEFITKCAAYRKSLDLLPSH
jgi:hypothetical protein